MSTGQCQKKKQSGRGGHAYLRRGVYLRICDKQKSIKTLHKLASTKLDCSQSPYFSVGFSRPVCFDGAAAILVCKSKRDLGRVPKLPRGGERSWEAAGKIGIFSLPIPHYTNTHSRSPR